MRCFVSSVHVQDCSYFRLIYGCKNPEQELPKLEVHFLGGMRIY